MFGGLYGFRYKSAKGFSDGIALFWHKTLMICVAVDAKIGNYFLYFQWWPPAVLVLPLQQATIALEVMPIAVPAARALSNSIVSFVMGFVPTTGCPVVLFFLISRTLPLKRQ